MKRLHTRVEKRNFEVAIIDGVPTLGKSAALVKMNAVDPAVD
jgi:precorrin-2 methylase